MRLHESLKRDTAHLVPLASAAAHRGNSSSSPNSLRVQKKRGSSASMSAKSGLSLFTRMRSVHVLPPRAPCVPTMRVMAVSSTGLSGPQYPRGSDGGDVGGAGGGQRVAMLPVK